MKSEIRHENCKQLRKELTPPEKIIWKYLRAGKLGAHFRRQHPLDNYILDFYCYDLKLCIEIDGKYHEEIKEDDQKRDIYLKELGIKTYRISAYDVFNKTDEVVGLIIGTIQNINKY